MARVLAVAFFNDSNEGKNFWPLLEPLREQNHQITLLTNADFIPPSNKDIEIWGLLKKGSTKDTLKMIPPLMSKKFDIVHFFHFQETPSLIHHMLFWFFKQQSKVVMASSLMTDDAEIRKSGLLKLWLQNSDIVTGFSRSTLAEMRTLKANSTRQSKIALPPMLTTISSIEKLQWSRADEEFLEETGKQNRILVPHFPEKHKKKDSFWAAFTTLLKSKSVVFVGTQKNWLLNDRKKFSTWTKEQKLKHDWLLTGENDSRLHASLIKETSVVWLAGLPLSSFDVIYWLSSAFSQNKPVVVDAHQARLYPELLRSNQSWCMVISSVSGDWPKDWSKQLSALSEPPAWMDIQHHTDEKINSLSRLYQKALEDKA